MGRGSFAWQRLAESIEANDTLFNTRVADNTVNRLDISLAYQFNVGRHRYIENGTYISDIADTTKLVDLPGKMQLTASAGDDLKFTSREILRYVPNYELLWGVAGYAETALQDGQHMAMEYMDDTNDNGYRYHFEGTPDGPILTGEQYSDGTLVDSQDGDLTKLEGSDQFDHTKPFVARSFLNWYGAGIQRGELSHQLRDNDGEVSGQNNQVVFRTGNENNVATKRINNRIGMHVWVEAGAPDLTVNVLSMGANVRGNATGRDREKPAVFYDINGISQYPTDNVTSAIAARIDPTRQEVAVKMMPPIFQPGGSSVLMGVTAYAVHKDNPDLTVNFADPDDDGTDEGPSPAAQSIAQTDVMQYTRDVTSIPTVTDIRADGTTGLVPDMRQLTTTIGQSGGGTNTGTSTGGEMATVKRTVHPNDVVIYLPRSDPASQVTSGVIRYIKTLFNQDW